MCLKSCDYYWVNESIHYKQFQIYKDFICKIESRLVVASIIKHLYNNSYEETLV